MANTSSNSSNASMTAIKDDDEDDDQKSNSTLGSSPQKKQQSKVTKVANLIKVASHRKEDQEEENVQPRPRRTAAQRANAYVYSELMDWTEERDLNRAVQASLRDIRQQRRPRQLVCTQLVTHKAKESSKNEDGELDDDPIYQRVNSPSMLNSLIAAQKKYQERVENKSSVRDGVEAGVAKHKVSGNSARPGSSGNVSQKTLNDINDSFAKSVRIGNEPSTSSTIKEEKEQKKEEEEDEDTEEEKKLRAILLKKLVVRKFASNDDGNRDLFMAKREKKPPVVVPTRLVPLSAFQATSPHQPAEFVEIPKHCPFLTPHTPDAENETKAQLRARLAKQTDEERHATCPHINTVDFINFLCGVDLDDILGEDDPGEENEDGDANTADSRRGVRFVQFPRRPSYVAPMPVQMEYRIRAKALDALRAARGEPVEPDDYDFGELNGSPVKKATSNPNPKKRITASKMPPPTVATGKKASLQTAKSKQAPSSAPSTSKANSRLSVPPPSTSRATSKKPSSSNLSTRRSSLPPMAKREVVVAKREKKQRKVKPDTFVSDQLLFRDSDEEDEEEEEDEVEGNSDDYDEDDDDGGGGDQPEVSNEKETSKKAPPPATTKRAASVGRPRKKNKTATTASGKGPFRLSLPNSTLNKVTGKRKSLFSNSFTSSSSTVGTRSTVRRTRSGKVRHSPPNNESRNDGN